MLFNLRMTLVKYANLNAIKIFPKKLEKQTDKHLTENQLTLNADKKRCYSLQIIIIRMQSFLLKAKLSNQLMHVVFRGVQIDSNLTFENHLNSVLGKMANAIRSLNLVRNKYV